MEDIGGGPDWVVKKVSRWFLNYFPGFNRYKFVKGYLLITGWVGVSIM